MVKATKQHRIGSHRRPPCCGFEIFVNSLDLGPVSAPKLLWKPEEGSISHRVQRLAKENCVIDDATGAEKVSLTQARIDMSELDEDSDGFLLPHEMEARIRGLIPNLAQLRGMPTGFVQMYCRVAAHKFLFFCYPRGREMEESKHQNKKQARLPV